MRGLLFDVCRLSFVSCVMYIVTYCLLFGVCCWWMWVCGLLCVCRLLVFVGCCVSLVGCCFGVLVLVARCWFCVVCCCLSFGDCCLSRDASERCCVCVLFNVYCLLVISCLVVGVLCCVLCVGC